MKFKTLSINNPRLCSMKIPIILIAALVILGINQTHAQVFTPYLALGTNITNDKLTESGSRQVGSRMGPNLGVGVSGLMSKRLSLDMEILFSQNGNYAKMVEEPTINLDKIALRYLEVPLMVTYQLKNENKKNLRGPSVSAGLGYAQLLKHKVITRDERDISDEISFEQDGVLLFNAGATSFLSDKWAVNGRCTISQYGNWTLALRLLYYIQS